MTCLSLTLYIDFRPLSPHVHGGLLLFDGGTVGASVAAVIANQMSLNVEAEEDDLL